MILIVGAGLSGSILAERIATQLNKKVLIIDKRNHIAGNIYDFIDKNGVMVHQYGPHAFHTNDKEVWNYLSQFTKWHPYEHRVRVMIKGVEATLPFNLNTIEELFPKEEAIKYKEALISTFGYNKKIPILKLLETSNKTLQFLGQYVYDNIYVGYTSKQWGVKPELLDSAVTARVPIYISYDNRYFQDIYQAIPKNGYTTMIKNMLAHENISLKLNTLFEDINKLSFEKIIFTGMIDEYYKYRFGKLPYRSLFFDFQSLSKPYYQSLAQINYPNEHRFTRITEFKHFLNQKTDNTTIAKEYPQSYIEGENEPYYPIPSTNNHALYEKYEQLTALEKNTLFVGRLANYKYINMDEAVKNALDIFKKNFK